MANEFKIRKGLIVEGASGGVVVNVLGSQGQLLSVTDNLSGSIFAVSDISGVPIFDVNSSGLSTFDGPATFSSSVTLSSTLPLLYLNNTTASTGKNWRLSSATNGKMYIAQDGVVDAITLDHTSGNATFAGEVSLKSRLNLQRSSAGATTLIQFKNEIGVDRAHIDFGGTNEELSFFAGDGTTENMTINSAGNAIFNGKVGIGLITPTGNLSMNSQIDNGTSPPAAYTTNTAATRYQSFFNSYYNYATDGLGPYPRFFDMVATGSPDGTNGGSNIRFFTTGVVAATGAVERMRITSAGNSFFNYPNPTIQTYGSGAYGGKVVIKASDDQALTLLNSSIGGTAHVALNFTNEFVANQYNYLARIKAEPETAWDGTAANRNSRLTFSTNDAGTIGEKMRIDSSGNLILNQATSRIKGGGSTTGRIELSNSDSKSYMMVTGSANAAPNLIYFVNDESTTLTLNANNSIKLNAYNSTNNTGTPTYLLGTDASGNVVKVLGADIPGAPAGSGTLNTVAMWTPDGDTLGDSPITISGNDITSSGRGIIENTTALTTGVTDSLVIKTLSSGTTITNGFGGGLSFYLENTVYSAVNEVGKIAVIETDTIAIDDKMVFSVKDNNILAERLTLTGQEAVFTGNVGIGVTGPSEKLQVNQTNNDIYQLTLHNTHLSTTAKARIGNWVDQVKISSNYMQSGGTKTQDNTAKASWVQTMGDDLFDISRSPAASTTLASLFNIDGAGSIAIGGFLPSGTPTGDYRSLEIGRQGNTITGAPWKSNLYFSTNATITTGSTTFTARYLNELPMQMVMEDGIFTWSNAVAPTAVGDTVSFNERMRINVAGDVGIFATNPGARLEVKAGNTYTSNTDKGIKITNAGHRGSELNTFGNDAAYLTQYFENYTGGNGRAYDRVLEIVCKGAPDGTYGEGVIKFKANPIAVNSLVTEVMRITGSGKVGIGTISPDSKLEVAGQQAINWGITNSSANGLVTVGEASTTVGGSLFVRTPTHSTYYPGGFAVDGAYADIVDRKSTIKLHAYGVYASGWNADMAFYTSAGAGETEKMRIDAAGNVGIGTSTPLAKLDIQGTQGQLFSVTDDLSGSIFAVADISGVPIFDVNSSGVSYFDGNVGIGTDNPGYPLHVYGTIRTTLPSDNSYYSLFSNNGSLTLDTYGVNSGIQFKTLGSTKLTITNGGNVIVGATAINGAFGASNTILAVKGSTSGGEGIIQITGLGNNATDNVGALAFHSQAEADAMCSIVSIRGNADDVGSMAFLTNNGGTNTEKMRIDSGGNVGIGNNSSTALYPLDVHDAITSGVIIRAKGIGAMVLIESNTAGEAYLYQKPNITSDKEARFMMTAGTAYGWAWSDDGSGTPASRVKYMKLDQNPGTLTVKGDVVAYGAPSDISLKENIKPIDSALDKVMKLQGVTFDWKKTDSILELKEDIGFIAQDVQKVVPELIRENSNGLLSMRHQGVAPILLEAIKELKAEIDLLKSKPCTCNKCNCNI